MHNPPKPPKVRKWMDVAVGWEPEPGTQWLHNRYLKTLEEDHYIIRIYHFLQEWWVKYERPPTFVEIARGVRGAIPSNNTIRMALQRLVCAGWILRLPMPDHHGGRGDGHVYKPAPTPYSKLHDKVYEYCRKHYTEQGIPPTILQVTAGVGRRNDDLIRGILKRLVTEGYLTVILIGQYKLYRPPDMGVVNLTEYYKLLEWAGTPKKKAEGQS